MVTVSSPVRSYAEAIISGQMVAGHWVRLAAQRHLDDLLRTDIHFDPRAADNAIQFFHLLRLVDGSGAGQPFDLQPWQQFIVGSLFGWKRFNGKRRFRYGLVEVARANGKTPLLAGIGLYGLILDGEQGAQVYSAATTRDQAKIMFTDAVKMAEVSGLMGRHVEKTVNNLACMRLGSFFRPLSADAQTMDGLRVHMALVDELHEHPNGQVMAKLRTGMKSSQPLLLAITTAGYDRHSVCWEEHNNACNILSGVIQNDSYFAYIASLDTKNEGAGEDDDWKDETVWPKANPNLGISVQLDTLWEECELAKQVPGQQNSFKRLRLNLWTGQDQKWLDIGVWDENGGHGDHVGSSGDAPDGSRDPLSGLSCFGGLDLSTTTDLTAFILVWPGTDEEPWVVKSWFWVPEENIQKRSEQDRVPYAEWVEQGFLEATPGNVVDYAFVRQRINDLARQYDIQEISYDPWNGTGLATWLTEDGAEMIPISQNFAKLTAPTKLLEKLILGRQLNHGGHPILRWCANNAVVTQDPAGNLKPDKSKSTERIDGITALICALASVLRHMGEGESIYDTRGVLLL